MTQRLQVSQVVVVRVAVSVINVDRDAHTANALADRV